MNAIIINGSPRKSGNTARMCRALADGIEALNKDAAPEIIHLYDYDFKGCRSCFACKRKGAATYGKCAVRDAVSPILKKALKADILVLASPIYLMDVSGVYKSFLERLLFPVASYEAGYRSLATNKMQVATIYTMNVPKEMCPDRVLANTEHFIGHVFREPRRVCAYNTLSVRRLFQIRGGSVRRDTEKGVSHRHLPARTEGGLRSGQRYGQGRRTFKKR